MCRTCDYVIFRLQREIDLAKSRLERDKFDTLNSLLADAEIARWSEKEGAALPPVETWSTRFFMAVWRNTGRRRVEFTVADYARIVVQTENYIKYLAENNPDSAFDEDLAEYKALLEKLRELSATESTTTYQQRQGPEWVEPGRGES